MYWRDVAMAEARNIDGVAFKNGSATLMARIVGVAGANIQRGDIAAVHYTVFLLDDQDADARTAISGHADALLAVASVVFDSLQTDPVWTIDTVGYNFRHVLDVSAHQAFAVAGRRYLVEYRLTPTAGQVIVVRFRINVI
jgi:hypothetical protein